MAMFRTVQPVVWAFDCEWVPDAEAGRRLLGLPPDCPERDVFAALWADAGATEADPRPFLKTYASRLVSVAVVERREQQHGQVALCLRSMSAGTTRTEADVLRAFFGGLAKRQPQLVGFNSRGSDLPILVQRGVVLGVPAPGLCACPARPWDDPDYFWGRSEWHLDLMAVLGGRGAACPSLKALALLSGLPAKANLDGGRVADTWLAGDYESIRMCNETDAVTMYLLWLRAAFFAGHFDAEAYAREEARVEVLLERQAEAGAVHLADFLDRWRVLDPVGKATPTVAEADASQPPAVLCRALPDPSPSSTPHAESCRRTGGVRRSTSPSTASTKPT
ncbi:MAG: hypothetical protein AAF089_16990 [Bacteroidota bacterium]